MAIGINLNDETDPEHWARMERRIERWEEQSKNAPLNSASSQHRCGIGLVMRRVTRKV